MATPEYRARLSKGREKFFKVLDNELKARNKTIPESIRSKWVVSEDLGRLNELWEAGLAKDKYTIANAPIVGNDILALQGHSAKGKPLQPILFRTKEDIVDIMMHPKEVHAFPVSDRRGNHLATVIHVGPDAPPGKVRRLARLLIKDPNGFEARRMS